MKTTLIFTIIFLLVTLGLTAIVPGTTIDTNYYYRLSTRWSNTDGKSLDVINDANDNKLIMATSGSYSGQFWRIHDLGNGFYRLTTIFQGTMKSLDSNVQLSLSQISDSQSWSISSSGG